MNLRGAPEMRAATGGRRSKWWAAALSLVGSVLLGLLLWRVDSSPSGKMTPATKGLPSAANDVHHAEAGLPTPSSHGDSRAVAGDQTQAAALRVLRWPDSEPIANADICWIVSHDCVKTDALGTASVSIPNGFASTSVRIAAEGFDPTLAEIEHPVLTGRTQDIYLQPTAGYIGRILNGNGEPVVGASVEFGVWQRTGPYLLSSGPAGASPSPVMRDTHTLKISGSVESAASGYFYIAGHEPLVGELGIIAVRDGLIGRRSFKLPCEMHLEPVEVHASRELEVRVVDRNGDPVVAVSLDLMMIATHLHSEPLHLSKLADTDNEGFTVAQIDPQCDQLVLRVNTSGIDFATAKNVTFRGIGERRVALDRPEGPLLLVVTKKQRLRGTVFFQGAAHEVPIAGASIVLTYEDARGPQRMSRISRADGVFEFAVPENVRSVQLEATKPGFGSAIKNKVLGRGEDAVVAIEIVPFEVHPCIRIDLAETAAATVTLYGAKPLGPRKFFWVIGSSLIPAGSGQSPELLCDYDQAEVMALVYDVDGSLVGYTSPVDLGPGVTDLRVANAVDIVVELEHVDSRRPHALSAIVWFGDAELHLPVGEIDVNSPVRQEFKVRVPGGERIEFVLSASVNGRAIPVGSAEAVGGMARMQVDGLADVSGVLDLPPEGHGSCMVALHGVLGGDLYSYPDEHGAFSLTAVPRGEYYLVAYVLGANARELSRRLVEVKGDSQVGRFGY